jgi:hypothetical protein
MELQFALPLLGFTKFDKTNDVALKLVQFEGIFSIFLKKVKNEIFVV